MTHMDTIKYLELFIKCILPVIALLVLFFISWIRRKRRLKKIRLLEKKHLQRKFNNISVDLLYKLYYKDIQAINNIKNNVLLYSTDKMDMEAIAYHHLCDNYNEFVLFDLEYYDESNWILKLIDKISDLLGINSNQLFRRILNLFADKYQIHISDLDLSDTLAKIISICEDKKIGICILNLHSINAVKSNKIFVKILEEMDFLTMTSLGSKKLSKISKHFFEFYISKGDYISTIPIINSYLNKKLIKRNELNLNFYNIDKYEDFMKSIFLLGSDNKYYNLWLYLLNEVNSLNNINFNWYFFKEDHEQFDYLINLAKKELKNKISKLNKKEKLLLTLLSVYPISYPQKEIMKFCVKNKIDINSLNKMQNLDLIISTSRLHYSNFIIEFFLIAELYPHWLETLFFSETPPSIAEKSNGIFVLNINNNLLRSLLLHSAVNILPNTEGFLVSLFLSDVLKLKNPLIYQTKHFYKAFDFIRSDFKKISNKYFINYEILEIVNDIQFKNNSSEKDVFITPTFEDDNQLIEMEYYSYYLRTPFKVRINRRIINHNLLYSLLSFNLEKKVNVWLDFNSDNGYKIEILY